MKKLKLKKDVVARNDAIEGRKLWNYNLADRYLYSYIYPNMWKSIDLQIM